MKRSLQRKLWLGLTLGTLCVASFLGVGATEIVPDSPAAILQELRSFGTVATILHVGAHPDDENTALITYFARGRGYRTAYLSLTRGDGGQNEIGPEFDEKLGVARTQELLAARKIDGGRQFFTRAVDFGFSKTPEETLRFWDREQVLGDVVRVIRQFHPDVIVTRFPIPPGSGGHGHHTASGILGVEAFKLAGDPKAYPEQIAQGLAPWQPKRVAWNGGGGARGSALDGPTVKVDIGGNDSATGEAFGAIASRSRGQHITQGFGNFSGRGGSGPNVQTFTILGGDAASNDLFDGIDTTWTRFPGGAEIAAMTEKAIADFKKEDPSTSVPALLAIRSKLAALEAEPVVQDKRAQMDRILQACLGLKVETLASAPEIVPGERLKVKHSVTVMAQIPVRWTGIQSPNADGGSFTSQALKPGQAQIMEREYATPGQLSMTQPYWLKEDGKSGIFRVDDPKLIGTPENAPSFPMELVFEIEGQKLAVKDEPVFIEKSADKERRRRVDVIPPVTLRFMSDVSLFQPGAKKTVAIEVIGARPGVAGNVKLETPAGWTAALSERPFKLAGAGEKARISFEVTAPKTTASERLTASATVNGKRFSNQRVEINYAHLPFMLLQPAARARVVCAEVHVHGKNAGYLPGAGDSVAEALEQLGYSVTRLTGADLTPEKLRGLDVVVVGVRAFNVRKDLQSMTNLFAFIEEGGTVVMQYNRPDGLSGRQFGPYPFSIQGPAPALRVTDETAPVGILAPEHTILTTPNRIGPADFEGWFQERGSYFPSSWDKEHYETILAMSDPGEAPLNSSILVAKHGKGYFVYTGITFFRQLPAGVPGAYRLFANLVSLGK